MEKLRAEEGHFTHEHCVTSYALPCSEGTAIPILFTRDIHGGNKRSRLTMLDLVLVR
jgi:hypothetical protein